MFIFLMKKVLVFILAALSILGVMLLPSGCSDRDTAYMRKAADELIDVLWNVDYNTFTPEKTTEYAKKYYDSDFLRDYESDIVYNAGITSVKDEKLITKVLSKKDVGASVEDFGDTTYQKYRMKAQIEIKSYKPVVPEDSIFEEGKKYDLIFTLYFKNENDVLKLSAFGYEPEKGTLLPKRANNVPLTPEQKKELESIAKNYSALRYGFDYRTYDPGKVLSFCEKNMTQALLKKEDFTPNFLNDFNNDIKSYQMKSEITDLKVLSVDENKTALDLGDGLVFYYLVSTEIKYKLIAMPDYFLKTQMKEGQIDTVREVLGFDFVNGIPKIAFAEYE